MTLPLLLFALLHECHTLFNVQIRDLLCAKKVLSMSVKIHFYEKKHRLDLTCHRYLLGRQLKNVPEKNLFIQIYIFLVMQNFQKFH